MHGARIALAAASFVSLISLSAGIGAEEPKPILGFSAAGSDAERELEGKVDARLAAADLREWMKRLTAHPHHVGSPWDESNAEWMRGLFASWGYQARIETFQVLFPTPKERLLEMTAPAKFRARLEEPAIPEDSTSGQKSEQLPTYNAYSIDGDVTGELVYVGTGIPADYDELAERGVDVKGKIVIARYGGSWRGIKPKVAAEHGAIGCIIYSDPAGDGYFQGDVYPKDGWRSKDSVQRGSVADMPQYSGDALTPGVGATADAKRLPLSEAKTLTRIPVLPISYADAQPLLAALAGPMAPEAWRGSLPIPYHLGPGPATVHLKVAFDWSLKPVHDVVAVMPGSEFPDEWVVRGNHHDGWVNGASDPISGMVALLAEAKAIGALAKEGFKPRRTLVFAGWDGEEPGLLGSTEWAETHADELRRKAVAYLNTDSVARGFLGIAGSHSLERFVNEVAREVVDPERQVPVLERTRAVQATTGTEEERREAEERADLRIGALGSGSDYTPFLQHLGIAALNLDFGGEEHYGQYHSIYDSFDHFTRFVDPDFAYGVTTAKVAARIDLRFAQSDILPFTLDRVAEVVSRYAGEVEKLADQLRKEAEERKRHLAARSFELAADPKQPFASPAALDPVPFLNFAPLDNAAAHLKDAAAAFEEARGKIVAARLSAATLAELNTFLRGFEHLLTREEGLPGRPWFVHQLYAPGQYTGYGVKTLPSIREALELRRWSEAEAQIAVVAGVLDRASGRIEAMTRLLAGAGG
jgi:N-acetylated-alpha-linked acidic dipeptidase